MAPINLSEDGHDHAFPLKELKPKLTLLMSPLAVAVNETFELPRLKSTVVVDKDKLKRFGVETGVESGFFARGVGSGFGPGKGVAVGGAAIDSAS